MEIGRIRFVVIGLAFVFTEPMAAQETEGRIEDVKESSSPDERLRAFARPESERLDDATRELTLVLGIGLLGFIALILGKYYWYEPRLLRKPYRPTKIKRVIVPSHLKRTTSQ